MMLVHRTYNQPRPLLDQSTGDVVWVIPCLVDNGDANNIFFDNEEHAWNFFNEINFQFEPLEIEDDAEGRDTELQTTQT